MHKLKLIEERERVEARAQTDFGDPRQGHGIPASKEGIHGIQQPNSTARYALAKVHRACHWTQD